MPDSMAQYRRGLFLWAISIEQCSLGALCEEMQANNKFMHMMMSALQDLSIKSVMMLVSVEHRCFHVYDDRYEVLLAPRNRRVTRLTS